MKQFLYIIRDKQAAMYNMTRFSALRITILSFTSANAITSRVKIISL